MTFVPWRWTIPPLPDASDDFCTVCGLTAPFLLRDRATGEVVRFCRLHTPPDQFPTVKPSLTRRIEEMLLERWRNESSPSAAA